jgi:hypothetical protein
VKDCPRTLTESCCVMIASDAWQILALEILLQQLLSFFDFVILNSLLEACLLPDEMSEVGVLMVGCTDMRNATGNAVVRAEALGPHSLLCFWRL